MDSRHLDSDVIVIGGGPAGSAVAITCAQQGLRVRLLERDTFPADRPGETLHPGVESLLAQLGVADHLPAVVGSRHAGIHIRWGTTSRFESYGQDDTGPWLGFQVWRADFDSMSLERARELGVEIIQPCVAREVLLEHGVVVGVDSTEGPMTAPAVVDASGRAHWLGTTLGIERRVHSPTLVARYGYGTGAQPELDDAPALVANATGWQWTAQVRPGLYQWSRVVLDGTKPPKDWRPPEFQSLTPYGPPRGADVTWRIAATVAQPGWFMVGDAAAVLDPSSAQGVLRALLSGMITGTLVAALQKKSMPPDEAATIYQNWLSGWYFTTAGRLAEFYRGLGVTGFGTL